MIDPEQRKELIILLKILQDETKWNKIYAYTQSVLSEEDEKGYPMIVREPVMVYGKESMKLGLTEDEAQEILDAYERRGGKSAIPEEVWDELADMAKYYRQHPEELIPWETVEAEIDKMLYA